MQQVVSKDVGSPFCMYVSIFSCDDVSICLRCNFNYFNEFKDRQYTLTFKQHIEFSAFYCSISALNLTKITSHSSHKRAMNEIVHIYVGNLTGSPIYEYKGLFSLTSSFNLSNRYQLTCDIRILKCFTLLRRCNYIYLFDLNDQLPKHANVWA